MTHAAVPPVRTDPDEQLTGRELRWLTARATAARAGRGVVQVVTDVANVVVSVVLAGILVVGVARAVGEGVALDAAWTAGGAAAWTGGGEAVPPVLLHLLLGVVVLALAASAAARTGPAGIGSAGVSWWAPTPADRRGLLVPSVRTGVLWGALAGGAGLALAGLLAGAGTGPALLSGLLGVPAGVAVVAGAGCLQPRPGGRRGVGLAGDLVVALVPVGGALALAAGSAPVPPDPAVALGATGALAVVACVLVARWVAHVDHLDLAALAARSGSMDRLGAALLSVDPRDLGRALDAQTTPRRPRRRLRFRGVRGPRTALVAADLALLGRSPWTWSQLAGLVALLVLAHQVPVLAAGPGLAVVVLAAGVRAARLGAAGTGVAEMVPALDAALPLSARATRATRTVVPALVAAAVVALGLVPLALATGSAAWPALGVLLGVGCGAAAVRGQLRPPPDWSGPLLATPMGAVPVNAARAARQGPDLALLSVLPFAVAAVVGVAGPGAVVAQGVVAAIACAVAAHPASRT
ncbi:DUF6297 family protein [Cellulosimicrobium marinum]|uniref:DUF6297 family protein n=1 Tax=Cellulosimicrobium marinum TaxID=1638992 RepID=UPI001E5F8CC1|nr:DUF6297 family protein [Cellulosimicrobium marinum]MCB7137714.1 DUF6297 family protein [Cellulosimicrobium marinum]